MRRDLRDFISRTFIKGRSEKKLLDSDSMLDMEVIDSTGVLELVLFLEQTFGFRVEDDEIIPDNMDSIDKLTAYVQAKAHVA